MVQPSTVPPARTYPCPACGTTANLTSGCSGCGRPADSDAAEVAALNQEIGTLGLQLEEARRAYAIMDARMRALLVRREQVMTRVRFATFTSALRPPAAAGAEPVGPVAGRAEASTRTVQNLLFILGGLLLGTAAIVFTAIAWATYGLTGRAVILGVVTAVALGLPALALWRGLRATAETFAELGLLLVVLDGYAAWWVDLFGLQAVPPTRYAGIVALTTALVALAYRAATGLVGPAFAALFAVQPALPLLAVSTAPDGPEWALVLVGVAALDFLIALWSRRGPTGAAAVAFRRFAWAFFAVALGSSLVLALALQASTQDPGQAAVTGEVLVFVALLFGASAGLTRVRLLHRTAGCAFLLLLALAAGRLAAASWPDYTLVSTGVIVMVLAVVVAAARPRGRSTGEPASQPVGTFEAMRTGAQLGALVAVGAAALGLVRPVWRISEKTITEAMPAWQADLDRSALTLPGIDWRVLTALVLLTASLSFLVRRAWPSAVAAGLVAVTLVLPGVLPLAWWTPSTMESLVAVGVAASAMLAHRPRGAAVRGLLAAALAAHAVLASLARPTNTAIVLAILVIGGVAIAALSRPAGEASAHRRTVGGVSLLVAFLATPWSIAAALAAAQVVPWWRARLVAATIVVLLAALDAVRRRWASLLWYSYLGTLASALLAPAWPPVLAGGERPVVYAGVAVLAIAAAILVGPPHDPTAAVIAAGFAVVPSALLAIGTLDAVVAVLLAPYTWLVAIWSGAPGGVGLAPARPAEVPDILASGMLSVGPAEAVAVGLLGVALVVAAFAWWRSARAVVATGALALPVPLVMAVAALRPPWPVVAAASLALGLALILAVALRMRDQLLATATTVPGMALAGAGLAGTLPTKPTTLAALGVTVVASTAVGAAARSAAFRTTGWLAAVATAATTTVAALLAGDLSLRAAAFGVLGVAATALAGGTVLHSCRPVEGLALQAAAHATALVALAFTIGSLPHSAAVCTLWGVAVGVRALWPGTSPTGRAALAAVAAGYELLAWWLLLADREVALLEAYTLPLAAVALLAGWLSWRARPDLRSWVAYGPALAAAFLPSLGTIVGTEGEPWRRLLLGAAALLVVVAGSVLRLQAPVVVGGAVLAVVALHELTLVWDLIPRWIPLAVGGLILVGLAMTYERRRRDLTRLRDAVGRMT